MDLVDIAVSPLLDGASPALAGVLAVPDGDGPWPAVVIVHEAFGVTDVMRRQVQRMAAAGYLVVMPDLYTAGGARKCLTATFRAMASGHGRAWVDIESARQMLIARDDCTGRVGVLGFCMGGGFALGAATRGFGASSVNYGRLPKDMDAVLAGACPIVDKHLLAPCFGQFLG
jgi:carboxymethylenebutenolidase